MALSELVELGNQQGGRARHLHLDLAGVQRIQGVDRHWPVVDNRGLEAGRTTGCLIVMRRNFSAASATLTCEQLGHHQVHWDAVGGQPPSGLLAYHEPRPPHRFLEQRIIPKSLRVNCQVGVLRRFCQRYWSVAGV